MGHYQGADRVAGGPTDDSQSRDRSPSTSLLVVLSGPSGVGKDAVMDGLRDRLQRQDGYHFAVTATTRPMRPGERDGAPYRFLSVSEFEDLLASDGLLEHAVVYGNLYGTPKDPVSEALAQGKVVILKVDIQGAEAVRFMAPDSLTVFLAPPDLDVLKSRLEGRGTESASALESRLSAAAAEMKQAGSFNHVVVNHEGRLDETVDNVLHIVDAELRSGRPRRYEF